MYNLLYKLINARYSVPTWLWAIASTSVAVIVTAYAYFAPAGDAAPFLAALPFAGKVWGPLLTLGGLLSMLGMALHRRSWHRWGSMISFCMWVFGAIAFYLTGGILNVIIFAAPMLVFWFYKYLASYVREFPRL